MSARSASPCRPSVLVFDSGIGGLSVVRALRAICPSVAVTYLADSAGFPYGGKTAGEIVVRVVRLVGEALERMPVDAVVIACNTASTVALTPLRQRHAVPFIGVVPPVKVAAAVSRSKTIGLLATEATVHGGYLDGLIADFAAGCRVLRVGCPGFAELAEASVRGAVADPARVRRTLAPLCGSQAAGLDTVVLGCTHYPFLRPELEAVLGGGLTWLDPAEPVARQVARVLASLPADAARQSDLGAETAWFTGAEGGASVEPLLRDLGFTRTAIW